MKITQTETIIDEGCNLKELEITVEHFFLTPPPVTLEFLDAEEFCDANLDRNFSDCYRIIELLKMAYEAGKNGEILEIVKYRKTRNE